MDLKPNFEIQFPFKLKFSMTKILKIQYLPHLRSKNYENHFYATFSMWTFNNTSNMSQFPYLYMKENRLFVLFVMLKSPKPWCLLPCSW